jgi:hypothetical protein
VALLNALQIITVTGILNNTMMGTVKMDIAALDHISENHQIFFQVS